MSVVVHASSPSGYVAQIKMEEQSFTIDESGIDEGIKTGPDPDDYILSALGACTVITLHMYARRKKWELERAEVSLHMESLASGTNPGVSSNNGNGKQIVKTLRLSGKLSPEQIKRLEDISSRCPVQRTLESGIAIRTVLEKDSATD
ncbi:OsmC family protein [Pontibacter sp. JH31]|uniref:OsmC family protein n=1 Tax=Pontibacter aquaedesilientis TaxID=2766980 RepID=A0ABR7XG24_9BACT|nr:OsmC family protein [Pontibacter aquaedesilientis]MBD1396341.1 OsmC family protein [Pontibacter aquaedesilientis]